MRTKLISLAAVLLSLSCLCTPESVSARSVNRGRVVFHQPDGSAFFGSVMGDDFFRIKMTSSGECIIRDDDGWWCYAAFDSSGRRYSSGVRVGTNDAAARSASRDIPYPMLMQKASERRRIFDGELQTRRESFNAQRALTKAGGTPTVRHGIIILTEFSDVSFKYSKSDIEAMICSAGYTNTSGAPGSAKDYFEAQFGDGYEFQFEVSDIVKLTKKRAYYGSNDSDGYDKYAEEMVRDACILADAAGVDFSKYDDDGDGIVDTVFVIYAGEDEAETEIEEYIWAHQYYLLSQYSITLDGKKIYSYACASELGVEYDSKWNITGTYLAGIGTFCHEYSHTFGLKDLYDTDYQESGGTAEAMWLSTGLMDGGNMNNKGNNPPNWNAVDRMQLNIGNCMELTPGRHNLKPISENGDYYKLESGTDGEFFLIECRSNQNVWDKYIGGSGLLVYHIDQTKASVWSKNSNEVNVNPSHQYADLVEPTKGMRNSYLYDGDFSFSPIFYTSHYNALGTLFWPYSSHTSLDESYALSTWYDKTAGTKVENITLEPDGSVSFTVTGGSSEEEGTGDWQTKFMAIKLSSSVRAEDGSFARGTRIPLEILNAGDVEQVKWYFNSTEVNVDEDGKWEISESGELQAEVWFTDGSKAVVYKQITVK